ncbi:hypothetical protein VL76_24445, partial [Salmonella enterica subsp. enterica serovar Braenderup]|nr:hypothetical protein [Salmonella enterica subsp. enterica serovar Braenderup]
KPYKKKSTQSNTWPCWGWIITPYMLLRVKTSFVLFARLVAVPMYELQESATIAKKLISGLLGGVVLAHTIHPAIFMMIDFRTRSGST